MADGWKIIDSIGSAYSHQARVDDRNSLLNVMENK